MAKKIFKTGLYLIMTLPGISLFGQIEKIDSFKKELLGTWDFVELRDKDNNKIDTIRHGKSYEIPTGPLLTYRPDGTFSMQFTPMNTDNGKWYFDINENIIVHLLYYEKPYSFASKYLINKGHAKQDANGDYYEIIRDKVVELTENKLILLEDGDRQKSFKKLDE